MDEHKVREWFIRRFDREPEKDIAYYKEWVYRFEQGYATDVMDSESIRIWNSINEQALEVSR